MTKKRSHTRQCSRTESKHERGVSSQPIHQSESNGAAKLRCEWPFQALGRSGQSVIGDNQKAKFVEWWNAK
jgi:hypothetical protein